MEKNEKLTLRGAVQLCAAHTFPAAVTPALLGGALACGFGGRLRPWLLLLTILTAVALQAAVNIFNDCADFLSGLDNSGNCPDSEDAALVFGGASPKRALMLGAAAVIFAAVCGGVIVCLTSARVIFFAAAAAAAIAVYTVPALRFTRLPLGEALSGITMGGVLAAASFFIQTGKLTSGAMLCCIPCVITVGCIMLMNNTCDIEKDRAGEKRTFSTFFGRKASRAALCASLAAAAAATLILTAVYFPHGMAGAIFSVLWLAASPSARAVFTLVPTLQSRPACMATVVRAHTIISLGLVLSSAFSALV